LDNHQALYRAFNKSPFGLTAANETLIIGKKRGIANKKCSFLTDAKSQIRWGGGASRQHPKKMKKNNFFSFFP